MNSLKTFLLLGLIAGTGALTGCISSGSADEDSSDVAARVQATSALGIGAKGVAKVTICHVPPGNPANAHSITVGSPAVRAHLAHGDYLGACADIAPPDDSIPTDDSKPPKGDKPPKDEPPADTTPPDTLNLN